MVGEFCISLGSGASGVVTLVAADSPAMYYSGGTFTGNESNKVNNLVNFCRNNFLNSAFASSVRCIEYSENSTLKNNGLYGTIKFWFATLRNDGSLYKDDRCTGENTGNYAHGVRPVVVLKSGVEIASELKIEFLGQECWKLQ